MKRVLSQWLMPTILLAGFASLVCAADPDVVSSLVSYQYLDSTAQTCPDPNIVSPLVSYLYFDWLGDENLRFQSSLSVSYQFGESLPPIHLVPATRTASQAEIYHSEVIPSALRMFPEGSKIDLEKMTIVMTHGWVANWSDSSDAAIRGWPTQFQQALVSAKLNNQANILAWDWEKEATWGVPPAWNTTLQGELLGQALVRALGEGYKQPIHFMGHSLGTLVNARAANYLHDHGFDWARTHMTLFDEAEMAGIFNLGSYAPVPSQSYWVDSYDSLVGFVEISQNRYEAVNILLWTPTLNPVDLHGYSWSWYLQTIRNPSVSQIGFATSYETGWFPTHTPIVAGTTYIQHTSEFDFTVVAANEGVDWPSLQEIGKASYQIVNTTLVVPITSLIGEIESIGNNAVTWALSYLKDNATALHIILNRPASKPGIRAMTLKNQNDVSTNGSYLWIPLIIPTNAVACSFSFSVADTKQNDTLSGAIQGTNVFMFPLALVSGNPQRSGYIDITAWRGQQVKMFLGLTGNASATNSVIIDDVAFHLLVPPPLSVKRTGNALQLQWPLSPIPMSLESAVTVAGPWTTTTNSVVLKPGLSLVQVAPSSTTQFFRLRQR